MGCGTELPSISAYQYISLLKRASIGDGSLPLEQKVTVFKDILIISFLFDKSSILIGGILQKLYCFWLSS